ncbi:MAG: hypothetical protein AB7G80_01420 [Dongiaceae bacterium]
MTASEIPQKPNIPSAGQEGNPPLLPKFIDDATLDEQKVEERRQQVNAQLNLLPAINGPKTIEGLPPEAYAYNFLRGKKSHPTTVVLGVGLCTRKELSQGLPFDTIGQICAAEWTRRVLGLERALLVVADFHALMSPTTRGMNPQDIKDIALYNRNLLSAVAAALNLPDDAIKVQLASEFVSASEEGQDSPFAVEYQLFENTARSKIFNSASSRAEETESSSETRIYIQEQLATIEFLRRTQSMFAKISWCVPDKQRTAKTFDEHFFDRTHAEHLGRKGTAPGADAANEFSSIATFPGCSFKGGRQLLPPYILVLRDEQVGIEATRNCAATIGRFFRPDHKSSLVMALNLKRVIDSVEIILGEPLPGSGYAAKADSFFDRVFKQRNVKNKRALKSSPVKAFDHFLREQGRQR